VAIAVYKTKKSTVKRQQWKGGFFAVEAKFCGLLFGKFRFQTSGLQIFFFMKTLCVSNRAILTAIAGRSDSGSFANIDGRGRQPSVNRTDDEHKQTVKEHIQS